MSTSSSDKINSVNSEAQRKQDLKNLCKLIAKAIDKVYPLVSDVKDLTKVYRMVKAYVSPEVSQGILDHLSHYFDTGATQTLGQFAMLGPLIAQQIRAIA